MDTLIINKEKFRHCLLYLLSLIILFFFFVFLFFVLINHTCYKELNTFIISIKYDEPLNRLPELIRYKGIEIVLDPKISDSESLSGLQNLHFDNREDVYFWLTGGCDLTEPRYYVTDIETGKEIERFGLQEDNLCRISGVNLYSKNTCFVAWIGFPALINMPITIDYNDKARFPDFLVTNIEIALDSELSRVPEQWIDDCFTSEYKAIEWISRGNCRYFITSIKKAKEIIGQFTQENLKITGVNLYSGKTCFIAKEDSPDLDNVNRNIFNDFFLWIKNLPFADQIIIKKITRNMIWTAATLIIIGIIGIILSIRINLVKSKIIRKMIETSIMITGFIPDFILIIIVSFLMLNNDSLTMQLVLYTIVLIIANGNLAGLVLLISQRITEIMNSDHYEFLKINGIHDGKLIGKIVLKEIIPEIIEYLSSKFSFIFAIIFIIGKAASFPSKIFLGDEVLNSIVQKDICLILFLFLAINISIISLNTLIKTVVYLLSPPLRRKNYVA